MPKTAITRQAKKVRNWFVVIIGTVGHSLQEFSITTKTVFKYNYNFFRIPKNKRGKDTEMSWSSFVNVSRFYLWNNLMA